MRQDRKRRKEMGDNVLGIQCEQVRSTYTRVRNTIGGVKDTKKSWQRGEGLEFVLYTSVDETGKELEERRGNGGRTKWVVDSLKSQLVRLLEEKESKKDIKQDTKAKRRTTKKRENKKGKKDRVKERKKNPDAQLYCRTLAPWAFTYGSQRGSSRLEASSESPKICHMGVMTSPNGGINCGISSVATFTCNLCLHATYYMKLWNVRCKLQYYTYIQQKCI